ncbi:MAG: hypothetical protein QM532_03525, partial [Cyanobium sp. MAG06]|nr:hypothetical protein [Cyanobium sp. MAG06]
DRKYKRKFDNDINTDLRILEELHYHSENEHRYISEIKLAMRNEGLLDKNETSEIEFNIKDNFKNTHLYKKGVV